MKIATTFHAPSSVGSSVKCRLEPRELEHLVIATLNRIEVHSLQPQGLQLECDLTVWGKIRYVRAIPISGTPRSKLAVLIDHPDPEVVFLEYEVRESGQAALVVSHSLDLSERIALPSVPLNDLLVHPSGKLAIVHCYHGRIKIITLNQGGYEKDFDVALVEFNTLSLAFLPTEDDEPYSLAILHYDASEKVQLLARDLIEDESSWELSHHPSTILKPTTISSQVLPQPTQLRSWLIAVPPQMRLGDEDHGDEAEGDSHFAGGVLVVGGRKILLYELASDESRQRQEHKRVSLQKKKAAQDKVTVQKAISKQLMQDMKMRKPTALVDWPWGEVTASCEIVGAPSRFFIGENCGGLALLSVDNVKEDGLILIPLGTTSAPTALTYLTNQALYVGSHLGDSQIVTIQQISSKDPDTVPLTIPYGVKTVSKTMAAPSSKKKGKQRANDDMEVDDEWDVKDGRVITPDGSYLKVMQRFKNIAPILDAVLVDVDGSGQQLVTCSGHSNTGSLNVVRNGSEFQELAFIPGIVHLTKIWTAKLRFQDSHHSHIIASTYKSTILYRIKGAGKDTSFSQVSEAQDLILKEPTLAFGNVARRVKENGRSKYLDSAMVIQVVPSGIHLFEFNESLNGYVEKANFLPSSAHSNRTPTRIITASVNASQVAVAFDAGVTAVLNLTEHMDEFNWIAHVEDPKFAEVSAISIMPRNLQGKSSDTVAVSYWVSNRVEILKLGQGQLKSEAKSEPLPALVRSLQLFNFGNDDGPQHLFVICGLADGSFAHFSLRDGGLMNRKIVSLGHSPVNLTVCEVDKRKTILAAGSRTTVITFSKDSLTHSPLMIKDVAGACRLNTDTFTDSLLLSGPDGLTIGRVQDVNKLNIKTIPLGYSNPRRISYLPLSKTFAVACTISERVRVGDAMPINSKLKLLDASSFVGLVEYQCNPDEEFTSLAYFTKSIGGKKREYLCAGMIVYPAEHNLPVKGRLHIFCIEPVEKTDVPRLSLMASQDLEAPILAVKIVKGSIVVAAESVLFIYNIACRANDPSTLSISPEAVSSWYNNYQISCLSTYKNHVITGDALSSVSILKVSEDNVITPHARHYGTLNPVAVEALDKDHLIAANDHMNLFIFGASNPDAGPKILERQGGYHVGDLVTTILRGAMATDVPGGSPFNPEVIFCTSSGRIGVIFDVEDKDLAVELTSLQRNLAHHTTDPELTALERTLVQHISGAGGHGHTRCPRGINGRSEEDPSAFGFIDGDFLERFLDVADKKSSVDKIYAGASEPERLKLPIAEYKRVLEILQGMH